MTIAFNALNDIQIGYAAVFICVGFGFLILYLINKSEQAPLLWSLSFFSNSLGFLLWSGVINIPPLVYYFFGEVFHILGFFLLVAGAIKYTNIKTKKSLLFLFIIIWTIAWISAILTVREYEVIAGIALKLLRSAIFTAGGILLLIKNKKSTYIGKTIAGCSLLLWSAFIILSAFVSLNRNIFYGFLVGFQILAAFGMVAMLVDTLRDQTKSAEEHVKRLEGILPICSYCKKIRDENNDWRRLEEYIEDRTKAEFSHGICPECFSKHRPDK